MAEFEHFQRRKFIHPSIKLSFTVEISNLKLPKNKMLSADEYLHPTGFPSKLQNMLRFG